MRDVIEIILEHLYYVDNKFRPDSRALARYSRISRAWRLPAQILLYRQVNIRTRRDLESVTHAVSRKSRHTKILKHSVRVLRIRISGAYASNAVFPEQLPRCLRLFPYLYELRLNIQQIHEFDAMILQDLKDTPAIQSLMIYKPPQLEASLFDVGEYITLHLQLLQNECWPLKYFTLCGNIHSGTLSGFKPPIHRFKGIRLYVLPWMCSGEVKLVSWLLRGSLQTIENLAIPLYSPIVEKCSNHLRSFECGYLDPIYHPFLALPQVEEVLWLQMPPVHSTSFGISFLRIVPPMISHLGFSANHCHITRDRWKDLAPVLPKTLKRVSVIDYPVILCNKQEDERMISEELGGIEVRLFFDFLEYNASTVSTHSQRTPLLTI